jgi:hypothetical protein
MSGTLDFSAQATPLPTPANAPDFSSQATQAGPHPMAEATGSLLTDAPRFAGTAGVNALAGFLSLPRGAAQAVDWAAGKLGYHPGASEAVGRLQGNDAGDPLFPDYGTARNMMFNTFGNTEYQPTSAAGRLGMAGATALAGGADNPRSWPGLFAGGAAAQEGADLFPNHPIAGALGGFAIGSGAANAIGSTAGRMAAMPFSNGTEVYQAYRNQGIPTTLAGDVTQHPTLQFAQAYASKMPGGEGVIQDASQAAVDAWKAAVNRNAAALGTSSTIQDAGTALQGAAKSWLQDSKQQSNTNWANFKVQVPGSTPVPVTNFQNTLQQIGQQWGGADNLSKVLQPKMAAQLQDALSADMVNGALPWQALQSTRSRIGEMLESPDPIADTGKAALKQMYGALSQDMQAGAASVSPSALNAFNKANAYTSGMHALIDDHLQPILNTTNPEQAAQYALSQARIGGSRLAAIDAALPGQGQNLGGMVLQQAAQNGPGRFPAAMADNKISPQAQAVMFGPQAQGVQELATAAQAMKNTAAMANHSNTAVTQARGVQRLMAMKELAEMGHGIAGTTGAVAGGAIGMMSPEIMGTAARLLATNPVLARIYSTPPLLPLASSGALTRQGLTSRLGLMPSVLAEHNN